ncbi:MAG: hypothetical protein K5785_00910 [Nitrosarchaeum sp.]|nr:hypothetical protein [Nitrosarchaeum sp.]
MKKKGSTADNKEKRLQALEKILDKYHQEDKKPSSKQVIADLAKKGFKISRYTYYDDCTELAINDPFVQDLASKSYSKLVHDCFDTIDFAERKAREILEKKWTRSKATKREVFVEGSKQTVAEKTVTEEIAEPQLKALTEIRECAIAKVKLLGGDIIKTSAKKWSIQRHKDIETINELKAKIQELEHAAKH